MSAQPDTLIYRYLLLLLLPFIAAVIYMDGRKYDPGLLDFKQVDGGESVLVKMLPQSAGNFERVGSVRPFDKDNLFEHINGHAEYFISGGFKGLAVADYALKGENEACCSADVYQMGIGANAFGVLMGEVSDDFSRAEIGFMGFVSQRMLVFIKGPYYVKITAFRDDAPVDSLAAEIEKGMGEIETVIPGLEGFPREGAVAGTLRYFKEAYRGLDFLNRVFEQDYELDGAKFEAALIEGDEAYVNGVKERYFSFFKEEETEYEEKTSGGQPYYLVKDPFEGDWLMVPMKGRIFALYGTADEGVVKRFAEGRRDPEK